MLISAQIDDKSLQFLFIGDFSFLSQVKKLNFSSQNLNLYVIDFNFSNENEK